VRRFSIYGAVSNHRFSLVAPTGNGLLTNPNELEDVQDGGSYEKGL
jgi:hypothetical protein